MIDYSNGYPVQVTTNVTKDTPWIDILTKAPYIKPIVETGLDNWRPSNWKGPSPENYKNEEYKNVFLKLRFHGHIPGQHYFAILERYVKKYKSDKEFRKKVDEYIEMTEGLWKNKTNNIRFENPFTGKMNKWFGVPTVVKTEFGKKYYELENELIREFSKI